ncbi:Exportin-T-like protein [Drosera capensis]
MTSEDGKRISAELLDEVLPSVFFVMQNDDIDETFSVIQFLSGYVATMKSLSPLTEKQLLHMSQILEVIRSQICYNPFYRDHLEVLDKIGIEEEDRMLDHRKDLLILLRSVGRAAPDVIQVFIRNSVASAVASSSDSNVEEVEAALSLFYALGESMSDEAMRSGNGPLGELVPLLLSTKLPCHSNRLVALVYLETITRYMKFVHENSQYIPMALAAFLDERGIHHPNVHVSRRASYLFMRVVKLLKSKLVPFIGTILQSLQDTVARFTKMGYSVKEVSGSEDRSHIFEAIGILIGMEEVPLEKQSEYLSSLLTPLCQEVKVLLESSKASNLQDSSTDVFVIKQIVMAINALSKGFSEHLVTASRPAIGLMFKQTLDVLLQVLVVFPDVESLRSKVASFVHQMVETLGAAVFPCLPKALEQLLAQSEPKEIAQLLVLLNQLICKFKTSVHDILEEVFPVIASRVFTILPRDVFLSGPVGNTERLPHVALKSVGYAVANEASIDLDSFALQEVRELQELHRTMYTFLHVIATHDLSSVFLSPKSTSYLEPMMQLLSYTSCHHKDITVRKACVQIFIRLIKDWGNKSNGEEKVPGFQRFVLEAFATNCCLYSVLEKSFEFRDANTHILFGEIISAQKIMYEKFADEFLAHFLTKGLLATHCSPELVEQYRQKLMSNDIKAFKSFYQSLIEHLRHQQNGSLVFR